MIKVMEDMPLFKCLRMQNIQPDKVAAIFVNDDGSNERETWADIFDQSNRMARLMLRAGIGPGDNVAILMRNHPEFLYALSAALTIGAVTVPIDPRSKGYKLAFQIANVKSKGIIIADEFLENLDEIKNDIPGVPVLGVLYRGHHRVPYSQHYPMLEEELSAFTCDPPEQTVEFTFKNPAQIIHTSGTTGDPKGVTLRADRFFLYGLFADMIWQYQEDDIPYTGLSLTHGNAQSVTLFPAMAKGITAVISERFTKSRIWDICREYGCTTFSLLGGMMSGIYNESPRADDGDNPVRKVISAGTPRAIWEDFEKRFNLKIHEWYAAIEGGLAHNPPGTGPVGSFGKPLDQFMEMKVVDENDTEVPPGEKGELISRMKTGETEVNYVGKDKESKEKTRGGWLRSGDICHRDENGFFYFDFRKGGGLRRQGDFIQPDLVEKIIGEHPTVSEVCVYGIPSSSGAPGESDIVAAIALFNSDSADIEDIKKQCSEKLEKNSIPSYLQIVAEIPKTVTEKPLERILRENFSPTAQNVYRI
ncbi:MAG TPA: AMP-binding protein [Spirochaetota bacterium]|nr:AMP-binding protein [Spirochaetota bacterium]HPI87767.1 AMP-binding protein [Spirochaetota bacterium]HPR47057.1 AMP-binding protein [Spirochaetota bacterium]